MTLFYFDDTWTPTSENINALPDKVKAYIHEVQTEGDKAFTLQNLVLTKDQCEQLQLEVVELQARAISAESKLSEIHTSGATITDNHE